MSARPPDQESLPPMPPQPVQSGSPRKEIQHHSRAGEQRRRETQYRKERHMTFFARHARYHHIECCPQKGR